MKRFVLCVLIVALSLFSLIGCTDKPSLARTPEEEYERIRHIDGENIIFNFDTLQKLQISMNVQMSSPEILSANSNKPIENNLLFQLDKSNTANVKSYTKINFVSLIALYNSNPEKRIIMDESIYSYKNNHSSIGGYFASYTEFALKDPNGPDAYFRTSIKLFDIQHLENLEGKRSFGTYTTKATVKAGSEIEFLEWYMSFFRFVSLKNSYGVYNYFEPETVKDIVFEVKSNAVQLLEVNVTFTTDGKEAVTGSPLTFTSKSKFEKSGFNVEF